MKTQLWGAALALSSTVAGFRDHGILRRQSKATKQPVIPNVPSYNISMPVDHFNSADTRTFNNRYFVNDTYYKEGGPVVFFDFGESGVSAGEAALLLAGWGNATSSAVEVAKALNGVIIGWEHRYYGYSRPFNVTGDDDEEGDTSEYSYSTAGIPVGGAADYKYLTVEQALEDVVYFANNFNKTQLGVNNTVLSGTNATQRLGPYHTPWIWIGGSYPGNRGAWSRLRNPEIMYAVWASSAPVQAVPDGAAYFNSIYRGIPKNCSSDIQATAKYVDKVFAGDDATAQLAIKVGATLASGYRSQYAFEAAEELGPEGVNSLLFQQSLTTVQSLGISKTMQRLCDHMESFNVDALLSNSSSQSNNITTRGSVFKSNDGDGKPSDQGIAASYSSGGKGWTGEEIAFSALLYGVYNFNQDLLDLERNISTGLSSITSYQDTHSWEWQVLTELGLVPNFNVSSPLVLGTSLWNQTVARQSDIALFKSVIPAKDIPAAPNQTFAQSMKGWDMTPTNVMFTNGEFDPWRAFGVMSLDQDLGAPQRKVTQDIPKCGQVPSGTDVFGLLYGGAVHAEDIAFTPSNPRGSISAKLPVLQGAELFVSAYNAWLPCFNASRTEPPPGNSPTNAGARLGPIFGAWQMVAVLAAFVVYHLV